MNNYLLLRSLIGNSGCMVKGLKRLLFGVEIRLLWSSVRVDFGVIA